MQLQLENGNILHYGIPQGSPEWFALKVGKPSASNMNKVMGSGEEHKKYLRLLAGERITGKTEETFKNGAMLAGQLEEPIARAAYAATTGCTVFEVTTIDCGSWCASPDSFVDGDGIIEVKRRIPSIHIEAIELNKVPTENIKQIQANLLASGREWCDYISYCEGFRLAVIRVLPDLELQSRIQSAIESFNKELNALVERLQKFNDGEDQ